MGGTCSLCTPSAYAYGLAGLFNVYVVVAGGGTSRWELSCTLLSH